MVSGAIRLADVRIYIASKCSRRVLWKSRQKTISLSTEYVFFFFMLPCKVTAEHTGTWVTLRNISLLPVSIYAAGLRVLFFRLERASSTTKARAVPATASSTGPTFETREEDGWPCFCTRSTAFLASCTACSSSLRADDAECIVCAGACSLCPCCCPCSVCASCPKRLVCCTGLRV